MQLRPFLSRIIGPYVATVAAWLGGDALGLSSELVADLETALTTATVLMLYGVAHKGLDALGVNPGDIAGGDGS